MNFVKEVELFIPASNKAIVESQQAEKLDEQHCPIPQLLHRRNHTAQLSATANSKGKEKLENAERRIQNPVIILSSNSGGTPEDQTPTHPVIHHGIFCDGPSCMKYPEPRPIEGARYKCMKCMDKDFCLDCVLDEANPHEKMHPLMKCTTPDELPNLEGNLKGKKRTAPREINHITKPHELHSIRVQCTNQITQTIIKDVLARKQDQVNSAQDPAVQEMVRDLKELTTKAGRMDWVALQTSLQASDKHDKQPLSDEEMDRISLSFVLGDSPTPDHPSSPKATLEEHKAWSGYKHHQFIQRWGLLSEDEGLDEEWWIEDPVILDENDPSYLCEMCRHINFNVLLTQRGLPGNQEPGPTRIGLYSLAHVLRNHPCAFCLLIRRSLSEKGFPGDSCPDDFEGQTIMLTVLDGGKYALQLEVSLSLSISQAPHDSVTPIVIQWLGETSEQPLRGLPVRPDMANLTRLKSWMDMCDSLESTSGGKSSADITAKESISLRFIDLNENRIVTRDATCRYACLSYVWGGVSQTQYTSSTKATLEAKDGLLDHSLTLPQTIRDTMKVARDIGLCYLWIDALCIMQDSTEDVAKNVTMMDEIYGGAALTIVASTNVNPHCGLPGVSTTPRSKIQITQTVQGMCLSTAFHDLRRRLDDIENSIWNTRAWTYQERHLSSRSVYFTDSEMVFICPFATFFEDTIPAMDLDYKPSPVNEGFNSYPRGVEMQIWRDPTQHIFPNKSFQTDDQTTTMVAVRQNQDRGGNEPCSDPSPIYRITRLPGPHLSGRLRGDARGLTIWDVYVNAVKNYTQRNMAFDADAVNAFLGLENFIAKGVNTKFWFGIPEFAFDRALLWYPRETVKRRKQGDRALFPSWSWSAWKGSISYKCKGWHNAQYHGPASVIDWYCNMTVDSFVERYPVDSQSGQSMREFIEERNPEHLLSALDSREIMKIVTPNDGWVAQMDEESNQHYYTHEKYPGICFSYPVNLPGEEIVERPDPNGILYFKSSTVRTRLCDMSISKFTAEPPKDDFIQIGTKDEKRSANYRAPWQRILYHQGYRCGFLVLNIPFEELESTSEDQYYLAAISRECLPEIPNPGLKGEMYKALDPRQAQHFLHEMRHDEKMETPYSGPNPEALPDTTPMAENGDPFWDLGRFSMSMTHPVYNVLFLKKDGKFSERVGVGKMHFHAFLLANPSDTLVLLR